MVCPRCIYVVNQILTGLGIEYIKTDLGFAVLKAEQRLDLDVVNKELEVVDLGLVRDQTEVIVTQIKKAVHDYLENISQLDHKLKLSEYIAQQLGRNYHQLSKTYSQYMSETIEQYFIELRTNKVKELVKQGKLNLSQIAVNVGYSSIYYLSGQYKKYTGQSLSLFKKEWEISMNNGNNVGMESKDRISENQNIECDCGCKDCDCKESKSFSGVTNFSNPTVLKKEIESDIHTRPIWVYNLGEYRVHSA